MIPAGRLEPQPWMIAPAARKVVAALAAKGAEIRFVGGCVRDAVLGRRIKDIDIATHDPPEAVMALLAEAGIEAIPTGIEHGTVTAVIGNAHFEITTLRQDVETYGRRAKVAFTNDWAADAARRDLTINALFMAPDGTLYDPFGGLEDLHAGRVRFVGDPRARIREDVLRLLRFFRFYAHYGKPPPDAEALAACRELAPHLPKLSGERVAGETFKLLAAPDPAGVVSLMIAEGVLRHALPEADGAGTLAALAMLEAAERDPLRRLTALLDPARGAAAVQSVADRLRLSNAERERLAALAAPALDPDPDISPQALRQALYRHGAERLRDWALLAWAREKAAGRGSPARDESWRKRLAAIAAWHPVKLPIKGADVLALGIPAGREVGRLISEVEAWWMAEDFRPDRAACLEKLKALARRG